MQAPVRRSIRWALPRLVIAAVLVFGSSAAWPSFALAQTGAAANPRDMLGRPKPTRSAAVAAPSSTTAPTIDPANYVENGKLIKAPTAITTLGEDLFGDRVNLYRGSLEFVQTDVSLRGNNALRVEATRRFGVGSWGNHGAGLFREWDLDLPRIHATFAASKGWVREMAPGVESNRRCSQFGAPPEMPAGSGQKWLAKEFWQGHFLAVPGAGALEMLRNDGTKIETHAVENKATGQIQELKTLLSG